MKNGKLLASAIRTLVYSWGGDAPPDAIYTLNELVDFINAECNVTFGYFLVEYENDGSEFITNFNEIVKVLESEEFNK